MNTADVVDLYDRADIYEAIYRGRGKDYAAESAITVRAVLDRSPDASSLLDVACGTGSHLRYFAGRFARVEGVDLSHDMVRTARANVPDVHVQQGDMRDFALDRPFDAVTCMFSSVGYLATTAELDAALRSFARHLTPGGVVVVEPWWSPDTFLPDHVAGDVVKVDGRTLSRVSHTVWHDEEHHASRMEVHYVVAAPDTGIQHFTDVHVMTLFTRAEYENAFRQAGLSVEFLPYDQAGPGLFVGVLGAGR